MDDFHWKNLAEHTYKKELKSIQFEQTKNIDNI